MSLLSLFFTAALAIAGLAVQLSGYRNPQLARILFWLSGVLLTTTILPFLIQWETRSRFAAGMALVLVWSLSLGYIRRHDGKQGGDAAPLLAISAAHGIDYLLNWVHLSETLDEEDRVHCRRSRVVFAVAWIKNKGAAPALNVSVHVECLLPRPNAWGQSLPECSGNGLWSAEPGMAFMPGATAEAMINPGSQRLVIFAVGLQTPPRGGAWYLPDPADLALRRLFDSKLHTSEEAIHRASARHLGSACRVTIRVVTGTLETSQEFQLGFEDEGPVVRPVHGPRAS